MKYKVYHRINPTFQPEYPVDFPNGFIDVAIVETEGGLEDVFRVTNHIDKAWWTNPEVKAHVPTSRSTSVGDVVEDENGKRFLYNRIGWTEFPMIHFSNLKRAIEIFIHSAPKFEHDSFWASEIGKQMANLETQLKGANGIS